MVVSAGKGEIPTVNSHSIATAERRQEFGLIQQLNVAVFQCAA